MDTPPALGQAVALLARVTEVHGMDNSAPPEHRTVMVRLQDGQQVMTAWSNLYDIPRPEPEPAPAAVDAEAPIEDAPIAQPEHVVAPGAETPPNPPPQGQQPAPAEPAAPPATPPQASPETAPVEVHTGDTVGTTERG